MANDETDVKKNAGENPLSDLLSNPEFVAQLSQIAAGLKTGMTETETTDPAAHRRESPMPPDTATAENNEKSPDTLASVLSNPELMAKLPDVIATIRPILGGGEKKTHPDKRTALLLALRPYLSPGRREAVDYITKLGKLNDLFKNLKP